MAHEIESTDGLVLHQRRAWHGLGTIVEDAPTPVDALRLAKLDWTVEQWEVTASNGVESMPCPAHRLNVRADTRKPLGMVSAGYSPIQNADLAEFCQLLAEQGDAVKVESAGSIRGGAKVWFLLKGESFSVRAAGDDEIVPYILVSNGHDGATALRCTPTTVRVVCSNTLHMVIPGFDYADRSRKIAPQQAGYVAAHVGDVKAKVEAAKAALGLYGRSLETQANMIDHLAAREINGDQMRAFFGMVYAKQFGPIPSNPKNDDEAKTLVKAAEAVAKMLERFDLESQQFGANAWTAANAYTHWLQHDKPIRLRDPNKLAESRMASNLFGTDGARAVEAVGLALSI